MIYKAFVKDNLTNKRTFLEYDYPNKKQFAHDIRANGYSVSRIEPKELYDFMLDHTNCTPSEWKAAKTIWNKGLGLTRENLLKELWA